MVYLPTLSSVSNKIHMIKVNKVDVAYVHMAAEKINAAKWMEKYEKKYIFTNWYEWNNSLYYF